MPIQCLRVPIRYSILLVMKYNPAILFVLNLLCLENDGDVVTSPYNSVLSSQQLIEHADIVFPLDNNCLQSFNSLENKQRYVGLLRIFGHAATVRFIGI